MHDSESSLRLDGRIALVTGGTRGLGRAIARKLVASGCHVLVNYAHSDECAQATVGDLGSLRGTAEPLKGDVSRREVLPGLVERIRGDHGRLDVFVHCATSLHRMPAVGLDPDGVRCDHAVALDPLLYGAEALAEAMTGGPGRIVAISSTGARAVVPGYASLGIAKAALESAVRYLAAELAGRGIAVNAVSTAKVDKGQDGPDRHAIAAIAARTPAGRATTPEDVAGVVALLCTAEAAWIHGQVITADGGLGITA